MKSYKIGGKEFVLGDVWLQKELVNELLESIGAKVNVEVKDGSEAVFVVSSLMDQLVKQRLVPKLLSMMVCESGTTWTKEQAKQNIDVLARVSTKQVQEIIADFFIETLSSANALALYLGILNATNEQPTQNSSKLDTAQSTSKPQ